MHNIRSTYYKHYQAMLTLIPKNMYSKLRCSVQIANIIAWYFKCSKHIGRCRKKRWGKSWVQNVCVYIHPSMMSSVCPKPASILSCHAGCCVAFFHCKFDVCAPYSACICIYGILTTKTTISTYKEVCWRGHWTISVFVKCHHRLKRSQVIKIENDFFSNVETSEANRTKCVN